MDRRGQGVRSFRGRGGSRGSGNPRNSTSRGGRGGRGRQAETKLPARTRREEAIVRNFRKMQRGREEPLSRLQTEASAPLTPTNWSPDGGSSPPSHGEVRQGELASRLNTESAETDKPESAGNSRKWSKSKLLNPEYLQGHARTVPPKIIFPEDTIYSNDTQIRNFYSKSRREMYEKKKAENQKTLDRLKTREAREAAIKERKEKRLRRQKVLNQKNAKGQPVFKGQIEMILEKLQGEKAQTKT